MLQEEIVICIMRQEFLDSSLFQCQRCGHCCKTCKNIKYSKGDKFKVLKSPCEYYDIVNKKCIEYNNRPSVCKMYPFTHQFHRNEWVTVLLHGACPECQRIAKAMGTEIKEYEK